MMNARSSNKPIYTTHANHSRTIAPSHLDECLEECPQARKLAQVQCCGVADSELNDDELNGKPYANSSAGGMLTA
jgi:hypothetical protein